MPTVRLCKFVRVGNVMVCEHGLLRIPITVPSLAPEQYFGACAMAGEGTPLSPERLAELTAAERERTEKLLGDKTKELLESVGITKDFYIGIKDALGFAPSCECDARVEWLNKAHAWARIKLGRG